MKPITFTARIRSGHKEDAVELPFDPAERWNTPPVSLWPGRRGHFTRGTLNGRAFDSVIVPRRGRSYLLISTEVEQRTGVSVGADVTVSLALAEAPEMAPH